MYQQQAPTFGSYQATKFLGLGWEPTHERKSPRNGEMYTIKEHAWVNYSVCINGRMTSRTKKYYLTEKAAKYSVADLAKLGITAAAGEGIVAVEPRVFNQAIIVVIEQGNAKADGSGYWENVKVECGLLNAAQQPPQQQAPPQYAQPQQPPVAQAPQQPIAQQGYQQPPVAQQPAPPVQQPQAVAPPAVAQAQQAFAPQQPPPPAQQDFGYGGESVDEYPF